jgi:hypothetical protein
VKRVVARDAVGIVAGGAGVDPEDVAEELVERLREEARLVHLAGVAVPDRHVQVPVRTELEHAAVVVRERLGDPQHRPRRLGICGVGIPIGAPVLA